MAETLALEVFEDGGVFNHGDDHDEAARELDGALDQLESRAISPGKYLKILKSLVERHPHFIDGHAHLGAALMEEGKTKLALQAWLRGFELGERAIPAGFTGRIEWGFLENRPFLRAAHGVALAHSRLRQHREAVAILEKMLAWNPGDNQGVRYLIGSEYLRAGETEKAERILADEAEGYPPLHYELALLQFRAGDLVAAATSLRRGFAANGYIAEMLSGAFAPAPLPIWHSSNFAAPETARDYLARGGDLWRRTPGAVSFLRWLHMQPKVLIERAAVLECQEALLWEHDFDRRGEIMARESAVRRRIDDALSRELVRTRPDRQGRQVAPWALHATSSL